MLVVLQDNLVTQVTRDHPALQVTQDLMVSPGLTASLVLTVSRVSRALQGYQDPRALWVPRV